MDAIDESRSALAGAITEFRAGEVVYIAARRAADSASAALHAALRQATGADLSLIEAQSTASAGAREALESLAKANLATITAANLTVEAAAGQAMRIAIDDLGATDADVVAWRNCRNALIRDAGAPLVSASG
jgi:hypothetical protein